MSKRAGPIQDLPFTPDIRSYMSRRLRAVGIEPDRAWLAEPMKGWDALLLDTHAGLLKAARDAVPKSYAHWEMAEFYRCAVPAATFDLHQAIDSYEAFAFLYERLLGRAARPWLRSLYLAVVASPNMIEEDRIRLVGAFRLEHLRFDPDEEPRL